MVWLALGVGGLLFGLWLLRVFATATPAAIRQAGFWLLAVFGAGLLALLLLSGRGMQSIWTLAFFGPVLWRKFQGWRAARRFAGRAAPDDASLVETATLAMRLDHASGRMSGRVLRGPEAGRELAELPLEALLALLAECRAGDPDSVPLLEVWLDRTQPDWRVATPFGAPADGPMTHSEALAVLGLEDGAAPDEVRAAHRRLMRSAHPDHGGSDWLAARINQARDLLLD
ncbi:MAG: hypothetical protein JWP04_600 [Belnapia sp.]|nr:hypothetical protein [Belnapia sp.]